MSYSENARYSIAKLHLRSSMVETNRTLTHLNELNDAINAMIEEIEHLRAAIAALQASVPPTHPSDYGHEVWAAARHEAVAEERAAVVAYLRTTEPTYLWCALLDAADAIERGEHRREEKT